MTLMLLLLAGLFSVLAWDAWCLGKSQEDVAMPFAVEHLTGAKDLQGIGLARQEEMRVSYRLQGLGRTQDLVLLWLLLAIACAVWAGLRLAS